MKKTNLKLAVTLSIICLFALSTFQFSSASTGAFDGLSYCYMVKTQADVAALPSSIDASGYSIGLLVEGPGLKISGLEVYGALAYGIAVDGQPNVEVSNCQVHGMTQGPGFGMYVYTSNKDLVQNNEVFDNNRGICLSLSNYSTIASNNVHDNVQGMYLTGSQGNLITGNTASDCVNGFGITLISSSNRNVVSGNTLNNDYYGISLQSSNNNIIISNTISNILDTGISLEGQSDNNIIAYNTVENSLHGMRINLGNNDIIFNNVFPNNNAGIMVSHVNNCIIYNNKVTETTDFGIYLGIATNSWVVQNQVTSATVQTTFGILLQYLSTGNSILFNTVSNSVYAIRFEGCSKNTISWNTLSGNGDGVLLLLTSPPYLFGIYSSDNNQITDNVISHNFCGVYVDSSNSNIIYHNNLVGNNQQALSLSSMNTWDNGYPSGGNYWSDYTGKDVFRGRNQNLKGSDGLGDTPYIIDLTNKDRYPLMQPWSTQAGVTAILRLIAS
jgi:parallel beta-helix repeat protein